MTIPIQKAAIWGTPGGKRILAKRLVALIVPHMRYVEPFAGAGAVFFSKEASDHEVLNDLDADVAATYRAIKALTDKEMALLAAKNWTASRTAWHQMVKSRPSGRVDRLHRFLYLSKFSYGMKRGASYNVGRDGVTTKVMPKIEMGRKRLREGKVEVFQCDYRQMRRFDGKNTFWFLDPPYPGYDAFNDQGGRGAPSVGEKAFDEEAFFEWVKTLKGKVMITTGVKGRMNWPGFTVKRISTPRSIRTMRGVGGEERLAQLLITNFSVTKDMGGGWELVDLDKGFPNDRAEGGIHVHSLRRQDLTTGKDGAHSHAFRISDGTILTTMVDGAHAHELHMDETDGVWGGSHSHQFSVEVEGGDRQMLMTDYQASDHRHYLQSEYSAFDGAHCHRLQLPSGEVIESLSGGELWRAMGSPRQTARDAPPATALASIAKGRSHAAALDSFAIGSVDVGVDGEIHVRCEDPVAAVSAALGRRLGPAESARARVTDAPPADDASRVAEIIVRMQEPEIVSWEPPEDRIGADGDAAILYDEVGRTLGKFENVEQASAALSEVRTLRCDGNAPGVLSWSAVESGAMPPPGVSMLPRSVMCQVPDHLRFWKHRGARARALRDALFDSGFAHRFDVVDGRLVATEMTIRPITKRELAEHPAEVAPLERIVSELAGDGCMAWDAAAPPDADVDADSVFVPADIAARWAMDGTLGPAIDAFERHVRKYLIACPDSVAARCAGADLRIMRPAAAGLIMASNMRLDFHGYTRRDPRVPMAIAFENESEFALGKDADGRMLLVIGRRAFVVQKDIRSTGMAFAAPVEEHDIVERLDGGSAFERDDGLCCVFTLKGESLTGTWSARPSGNSLWRVAKDSAPAGEPTVRRVISKADDKQFALGVVLEPETKDAHGDVVSAEDIEAAAHGFMLKSRRLGLQHRARTREAAIVESYILPERWKIQTPPIRKGAWMMGALVFSSRLWQQVKQDGFTGWSIGGTAFRGPA